MGLDKFGRSSFKKLRGARGPPGEKGEQGIQGPPGEKGLRGERVKLAMVSIKPQMEILIWKENV